jgi:large subunit ribosomal protein L11
MQLEEVAKLKKNDLNAYSIDSAINIIAGTAKSMGIVIE